jgi:hypothetical protein
MVWPSSQMIFPETLSPKREKQNKSADSRENHILNTYNLIYSNDMICAELITNLFPESVAIHLLVVITEWSICKGTTLQIHVIQLSHVCSHDLISIDKNNLFESIRETTSLELLRLLKTMKQDCK